MISYIGNQQLSRDAEAWAAVLPRFDAFIGVPRGGCLIAALLACRQNARLLSLEHLAAYRADALKVPPLHVAQPVASGTASGRILLVDDNVSRQANTFRRIGSRLGGLRFGGVRVETGSMYRSDPATPVDHWFADVSPAPVFEYDWFRRHYVGHAGFDLDGVLCEDYPVSELEHPDPVHLKHVETARCILRPRDPVKAVVTGRLSRHRDATERWLARSGIRYGELIMYDSDSAGRRAEGRPWAGKAEFLARPDVWFFVESDFSQAKCIFEATGKPVLCTATGVMLQRR